jgi:hypothetical protein
MTDRTARLTQSVGAAYQNARASQSEIYFFCRPRELSTSGSSSDHIHLAMPFQSYWIKFLQI